MKHALETVLDGIIAALVKDDLFHAVLILGVAEDEDGDSDCRYRADGNYHATVGMALEFVASNRADADHYELEVNVNREESEEAALDEAMRALKEHFSAIQILATWSEDSPSCSKRGFGNAYARRGAAQEFLNVQLSREVELCRDAMNNDGDEPEAGEEWKNN